MRALGIDPGMAKLGAAVAEGDGTRESLRVLFADRLAAKKGDSGSVLHDDVERIGLFAGELVRIVDDWWPIDYLAIESFTAARSYRAGKAQALVLGMVATIIRLRPPMRVVASSPIAIKKAMIDPAGQQRIADLAAGLRGPRQHARALEDQIATAGAAERMRLEAELKEATKRRGPSEREKSKLEKQEMIRCVATRHPEIAAQLAKSQAFAEHVADAVAAIHACSPEIAALERAKKPPCQPELFGL